jgi:thiol-disulfide isomerase/thioredoxin
MSAVQIGPLSLPLMPLVFIIAWLVAQQLAAWRSSPERRAAATGAVSTAGLVGLFVSRATYVLMNFEVYRDAPLSMIDIRDGGWSAWVGLSAGVAWLVMAGIRDTAAPRVLALAAGVGLAGWQGAGAWVQSQQAISLPAVALQRMASVQAEPAATAWQAYRGKPFVVNLWATWCAPCREEMPAFAQVQLERPGVPIIFVNQGESLAAVRAYLGRLPQPLEHVLLDQGSGLSRALNARGLPTTIFVDVEGRIRHVHAGVMNRAALRARIDALK